MAQGVSSDQEEVFASSTIERSEAEEEMAEAMGLIEIPLPAHLYQSGASEIYRMFQMQDRSAIQVVFNPNAFEHPEEWGIVFADALRHVIFGIADSRSLDQDTVRGKVLGIMIKELRSPTDKGKRKTTKMECPSS